MIPSLLPTAWDVAHGAEQKISLRSCVLRMMTSWKDRNATIRIVAVYALFGGLWILFSDTVMGFITRDPDLLERISLFKGLAFVLITALLLYHLINRHVRRISDVNSRLQSSMEDLRTAHQKLQLADFSIRNVCDAVYWITLDGRIMDCNQAACAMLGYDREELLSMSVTDLDPDYANEDIRCGPGATETDRQLSNWSGHTGPRTAGPLMSRSAPTTSTVMAKNTSAP